MLKTTTAALFWIISLNAVASEPTFYSVILGSPRPNQIIRLETHLTVPAQPNPKGTLFLWPGLQPGNGEAGVLQPVLTWGPSCAPGSQPAAYSTWWVSGQYVNPKDPLPNLSKCNGGDIMAVAVGDDIDMAMELVEGVWVQTITDTKSGKSVRYQTDLLGQKMNFAHFVIEEWGALPQSSVTFSHTTIRFQNPDPSNCKLIKIQGQASLPRPEQDGNQCAIDSIVLQDPTVSEF